MGISIGAALEFMFGVSVSIGIYWDDNYNFEAQWSYSVPFVNNTSTFGTVAAGVGLTFQYTNKDTVRDLYGPTTTYGGSAGGDYFYVGGDLLTTDDVSSPDMRNDGFQITGGVGVGLDFHFANTMTQRVGKYIPPVHTVRESPFGESDQPSMPNYLHDGSFMPCQCILCKFNMRH